MYFKGEPVVEFQITFILFKYDKKCTAKNLISFIYNHFRNLHNA